MSAMLTRRHFVITSATLFSGALGLPAAAQDRVDFDTTVERPDPDPFANNPWGLHPRFMPTRVAHRAGLTPGDIHVDAVAKYLYKIGTDGTRCATAWRSGVRTSTNRCLHASAQGGMAVLAAHRQHDRAGAGRVWQFADGMPGGPGEPAGCPGALPLRRGAGHLLRIHGTPQPWSIGTSASSGCVRMVNAHIMDMYEGVELGATAHLYPPV
jgi:lipoprotein-anchoring transpeptidase ErfK/SrfK